MESYAVLLLPFFLAVTIDITTQCPSNGNGAKAAHKSGEVADQAAPITLATIRKKLKESKIFDFDDPTLNDRERKELSKLFETIEIMIAARARQPFSVQNMFATLRLVERVVKNQLKDGQISESLASKFKWEKLLFQPEKKREANVLH
ncbi:unnamed protein product, partial [Iphiclides podalirius]